MADIDETNPLDNAIVSQFPANERASRVAFNTIVGAEHDENSGRHKIGVGNDAARDAITDWEVGSVWFNTVTSPATMQRVVSTGPVVWEDIAFPVIPATTKMVFYQAAAPTGWTLATGLDDRVLRVNNATAGTQTGSWTISGITTNNHTLSAAESGLPSHRHTYDAPAANVSNVSSGGITVNKGVISQNTAFEGGTPASSGHNHGVTADGNWRPAGNDVLIATKD